MAETKQQPQSSSSKDSGTSSSSSKPKAVSRDELDELKGRIEALENASSGRA